MTLTVLSDDQVKSILEDLTVDELDEFRAVLSSALNEFSTNTQADLAGLYQQPDSTSTYHASTKTTTLYMPSCGPEGMGCKGEKPQALWARCHSLIRYQSSPLQTRAQLRMGLQRHLLEW